jgi:hypothetical protein
VRERFLIVVLQMMARQADADLKVEDAKASVLQGSTLPAAFDALDRFGRGYAADTDFWHFGQDLGSTASLTAFSALVRETQLRRPRKEVLAPGRLSMREVGDLVFAIDSAEHAALQAVSSDGEARSVLYLLQNSEPCPRCGLRVQRDADVAGCPYVTCPSCGASFQCYCVVGDATRGASTLARESSGSLPATAHYRLNGFLEMAARCADELDRDRRSLTLTPDYDVSVLSSAFSRIAHGGLSFNVYDLRRAFADRGVVVSDRGLRLLRHRYMPEKGPEAGAVAFPEFVRQLSPSMH